MKTGGLARAFIVLMVIVLILGTLLLGAGFAAVYHFDTEIEIYRQSESEAMRRFPANALHLFINPSADAEPYSSESQFEDALYYFETPKEFTIISYSSAWNRDMLELLYYELLQNKHGEEMETLHEIVVYPQESEKMLASFTPDTTASHFFTRFPAFPDDFSVEFTRDIGRIKLYGGDTNTTIESMAISLSHEYGHLFTYYHMFYEQLRDETPLDGSVYAELREAARFDLITSIAPGDDYEAERFRYLFEIAAEDYVQLMGSPTTRQVVDFIDVQQRINGAEPPMSALGARNAFPQENMRLPLAGDVSGLEAYFFSFIDAAPEVPVEEKQEIELQITRKSVQYNLVSGLRSFVHYTVTWDAPYQNAIYTLVCYDPEDYSGWGIPIRTAFPDQAASAVIGEYAVRRGDQIHFMDDGLAQGKKVFFVVAMLPDGTFYISDKLEYEF